VGRRNRPVATSQPLLEPRRAGWQETGADTAR